MEPQNRLNNGQFGPNNRANPGGRPKVPQEVKDAFREFTIEARDTLVEVMRDPDSGPGARTKAAEVILNRAWGTPEQSVAVSGGVANTHVDTSKLSPEKQEALVDALVGIFVTNTEDENETTDQ